MAGTAAPADEPRDRSGPGGGTAEAMGGRTRPANGPRHGGEPPLRDTSTGTGTARDTSRAAGPADSTPRGGGTGTAGGVRGAAGVVGGAAGMTGDAAGVAGDAAGMTGDAAGVAGDAAGMAGGGLRGDAVMLGFARALRAAGVDASAERLHAFLRSVDALEPGARADVYWAGRLTLCGGRDDLERYDRVFAAYFGGGEPGARQVTAVAQPRLRLVARDDARRRSPSSGRNEAEAPPTAALASATEVLRHRDVSGLTPAEREQLRRLLAAFTLPGQTRRTARRRPARRGDVDPRRTVRELLRRGGEPARLRRHARAERPRRVVLLVDVSGSMAPYADALLRFAHAATRGSARTEVFTVGTRLTRVTRELSHRDPDLAMAAVAEAIPDWRGGTRLGELLREFLNRWGQRGMARGAVVVVLSDGWERGDPELLAAQMHRLHRLAHRVVWANPLKARPGYAPLAAGMAAALPDVDAFVEGHSMAALEELARVVRGAAPPGGRVPAGAGGRTGHPGRMPDTARRAAATPGAGQGGLGKGAGLA